MRNIVYAIAVAMPLVCVVAEVNPIDTRWTFGAHEPFLMYRRVGRICTGAIMLILNSSDTCCQTVLTRF